MCNKVGDEYEYSDKKAAECLMNNPNFNLLQVIAAEKYMALVARGKDNWKRYHHLFTDNGKYTTLRGYKKTIVIDGVSYRFDYHHVCQSSLLGSDRIGVNVIPLVDYDHADIHIQVSLFISDREVQDGAQLMINVSTLKISDFLSEDSDEIRRAMYNETNSARFEAQAENMKGNQRSAGPHNDPSERKSVPGNNGNSFAIGHTSSVVHSDTTVRDEFDEYKCASMQMWRKWKELKHGELITFDGRTIAKSSGDELSLVRYLVKIGHANAKRDVKNAAKKAAKKATEEAAKETAKNRWKSFSK